MVNITRDLMKLKENMCYRLQERVIESRLVLFFMYLIDWESDARFYRVNHQAQWSNTSAIPYYFGYSIKNWSFACRRIVYRIRCCQCWYLIVWLIYKKTHNMNFTTYVLKKSINTIAGNGHDNTLSLPCGQNWSSLRHVAFTRVLMEHLQMASSDSFVVMVLWSFLRQTSKSRSRCKCTE